MLVIAGSRCALLRQNNSASCCWDNVKQAFTGAGCVAAAGPTQCACRHLTTFASCAVPAVPMSMLVDNPSPLPSSAAAASYSRGAAAALLVCVLALAAVA
jgi:hypothetical protein